MRREQSHAATGQVRKQLQVVADPKLLPAVQVDACPTTAARPVLEPISGDQSEPLIFNSPKKKVTFDLNVKTYKDPPLGGHFFRCNNYSLQCSCTQLNSPSISPLLVRHAYLTVHVHRLQAITFPLEDARASLEGDKQDPDTLEQEVILPKKGTHHHQIISEVFLKAIDIKIA